MKTKVISLVLLLPVLLIGAVLVGPSFVDWNKYKPEIVSQAKEKAGLDLSLNGDLSVSILPQPTLKIANAEVKNNGQKLAAFEALHVSVELVPLLSKEVKVDDIELIKPVIDVAIDKNGKGNWENDILGAKKQETAEETSTETSQSSIADFSIDDLIIKGGLVTYTNAQTGDTQKIEALNVDAEIAGMQGPFSGDISFKHNGKVIDITGEVETIADMAAIPIDVTLNLDEGDADAGFKGSINVTDKSVDGTFSVTGDDISDYAGEHASGPFEASGNITYSQNDLKLEDFKAELADLQFTGAIAHDGEKIVLDLKETSGKDGDGLLGAVLSRSVAKATIMMKEKSITFPDYDIRLKGQHYKGEGAYKFSDGVELTLNADRVDVDQWLSIAGKTPEVSGSNSVSKSTGKPSGFSLPIPFDVVAKVGELIYDSKTYRDLAVDVKGNKNALTINKISLGTDFDTDIALKGKVGNTEALKDLDLKASLKTNDADALLKAYNVPRDAYQNTIGALGIDGAITGSLDALGFSTKVNHKGLTLSASGQAKEPFGKRELSNLKLRAQHANLVKAVQITQPDFTMDRAWQKPLDLSIALHQSGDTVNITSAKGKVGLIPVESGQLVLKTGKDVPSIAGNLVLGAVTLPKASTHKAGAATGTKKVKGSKWSTEPLNTSWMRSFNADLDLKAKSLTQNKWVFEKPSLGFDLENGALTVSELKANMFNGSALLSGKVISAQDGKGFSTVVMTADTTNLSAKSLYSAVKGKDTNMLTGAIKSASQSIKTNGKSMAALMANLSGEAAVRGERMVVNGVDITNFARAINGDFRGLNSLSDINNTVLFKGKTEFDTLDGTFDIAQGVVKLNPVTLDGPKATFNLTGNLDLPKWWIDINNQVQTKGEGDVPPFDMSFRGSLDNPARSAGGDALENLAKRKLNKLLGDSDVADKINDKLGLDKLGIDLFGSQKQQETEPAAGETPAEQPVQEKQPVAKPEDAIKDALGGILNGL